MACALNPAQLEEAKQMWLRGEAASYIGSCFKVTRSVIIGIAHRQKWGAHPAGTRGSVKRKKKRRVVVERPRRKQSRLTTSWVMSAEDVDVPLPDAEPARECAVNFEQLDVHHCRWPVGEALGRDQLFCGADRQPASPYCGWHSTAGGRKYEPKAEAPSSRGRKSWSQERVR